VFSGVLKISKLIVSENRLNGSKSFWGLIYYCVCVVYSFWLFNNFLGVPFPSVSEENSLVLRRKLDTCNPLE
jgi:hypothetical protein